MIYDKIENLNRYPELNSIQEFKEPQYNKGKFDMGLENAFGIGIEYTTKDETEGMWEAHKKYLDIHLILEGEEKVYVQDIENSSPTMDFDYENDYQLFTATKQQEIVLKKGHFLALFPNEVHKTGVKVKEVSEVKKVVFKVEL